MRRLLIALLCVLSLAAGCSNDDAPSTDALQKKASDVTDLLIASKFDEIVGDFNTEMRKGLTAAELEAAFGQVVTAFGRFQSRAATVRSLAAAPEGVRVFDTPMIFGTKTMKSRISFDRDGKIAGFFILNADVP